MNLLKSLFNKKNNNEYNFKIFNHYIKSLVKVFLINDIKVSNLK
jgi:hypothetical protein